MNFPEFLTKKGDVLSSTVPAEAISYLPKLSQVPKTVAPESEILKAFDILK